MANGLKGNAIAFTASGTETITISGAVKFSLQASAQVQIWTASQAAAGNINGQASHKQAWPANTIFEGNSASKQSDSDVLEDIIIEVPTTVVLRGWIWGQSATWVAS